ncbi:MAG: D-alanine--D-alanine ligase family protein [Candidatus Aminicenantes bacterium]
MKTDKNIILLFGGRSAEHEVSISSAAAIHHNLNRNKFKTQCIYINKKGMWNTVESPQISIEKLEKGPFYSFLPWDTKKNINLPQSPVYFPVLHGPYGEDGTIQGLLELADVPYVGATVMSSAIGMDKALSKSIFKAKGLPVVKYSVVYENDWVHHKKKVTEKIKKEYCFPLFIKPSNLGSSIGITKVQSLAHLPKAINLAFTYDHKILVEEAIQGRELECSVLGNQNPIASLPGEIIPYRDFYDYQDKYKEGKTGFEIPAKIPQSVVKEIQRISITAFKSIEGSGMARVDFFFQEKNHKIYLNEINTIPGFTEISMYPKLWEISGIKFSSLLEKLIDLAVNRHREKKRK